MIIVSNALFLVAYLIVYVLILCYLCNRTRLPIKILIFNEKERLLLFAAQLVSIVFVSIGVVMLFINGDWPQFIPLNILIIIAALIIFINTLRELIQNLPEELIEKYADIIECNDKNNPQNKNLK